jgi:hypothetical protein
VVKAQIFTGPLAGLPHEVPADIDPVSFLRIFLKTGWEWKLDVSAATSSEKKIWLRADLGARIIRALKQKRPVFYNGRVFSCDGSQEEVFKVGQCLEDAIVADDLIVSIVADNEKGLVIGIAN